MKHAHISKDEKTFRVSKNISQTGNNSFFRLLMKMELKLGKVIVYPVGIRCLLTCMKPRVAKNDSK